MELWKAGLYCSLHKKDISLLMWHTKACCHCEWKDEKKEVVKMKRALRKDLVLEGCTTHPTGCYIRFRELKHDEKVKKTVTRKDVAVDIDVEGNIIGIEFYQGLK